MKITAKNTKRLKVTPQINPLEISKSTNRIKIDDGVEIITLNLQQSPPPLQIKRGTNIISDDDNTMEGEEAVIIILYMFSLIFF